MLTCDAFDILSSTGAVAKLYDISCLYHSSPELFDTIQEPIYEAWVNVSTEITVQKITAQEITAVIPTLLSPEVVQANHYFIPNPVGTGLAPVWDFRTTQRFSGKSDAAFVGIGVASVVPPVDPRDNINWLRVGKISGDIADEVYRTDTVGGQPPTSVSLLLLRVRERRSLIAGPPQCTYGKTKDISVKYTSKYLFFGGSLR